MKARSRSIHLSVHIHKDPAAMAERAARLAGLDGAIRALPSGYDTPCTDGLFSQGEWQLLSIARAVAADPAVLLLDEITANLDAETETRVLEALRRASEGRTVLSISHRVHEGRGGRTIRIGPPEPQCGEGCAADRARTETAEERNGRVRDTPPAAH